METPPPTLVASQGSDATVALSSLDWNTALLMISEDLFLAVELRWAPQPCPQGHRQRGLSFKFGSMSLDL